MENFRQNFSTQVNQLAKDRSIQKAETLLQDLKTHLKSSEFKIELLKNFEFWFHHCSILNEQILKTFPSLYLKLEKDLLQLLCHPNETLNNFSLFLLSDLLQQVPRIRVLQISDYLIKSLKQISNLNESIFRLLSSKDSVFHSIQVLIKSNSPGLACKVAFYMQPNQEVFEFIKSSLTLEGSFELHYILARAAHLENLSSYLKNCASRVWALNSAGSKKKEEVLALVEYCSCRFLINELKNIEVLKSVIVTLTAAGDYLAGNDDFGLVVKLRKIFDIVESAALQESHKRKIKELIDRIRDKTEELEDGFKGFDISYFEMKYDRERSCLSAPINEIAMILGLRIPFCGESREAAISALESITDHLKNTHEVNGLNDD
jgi:hypothetical protein